MSEKIPGENSPEIQPTHELIRQEQLAEWNDRKYHVEKHGDEFSVVVVGETHFNPEFQAKQIELIRLTRPEFVLHEFLSAWIYNPKTQKFEKQKGRSFNMLDNDPENIGLPHGLVLAANEMGFQIIGCDLTLGELIKFEKQLAQQFPDKYKFNDEFEVLEKIDDPEYVFTNRSNELVPFRDKRMVETILDYQKKSARPVVSIIGFHHGGNIHQQKMLQEKGFGYAYVDQTKIDE